jgi:hypothetical protein
VKNGLKHCKQNAGFIFSFCDRIRSKDSSLVRCNNEATFQEKTMPQYLVAGYLPNDFDPTKLDESVGREIHALNKEMVAAGVRKFACGLGPAKSMRSRQDGDVLITDGPYLEAKEHIGGFWILECADMDEALTWARKGVSATRGQVEVREIFFSPSPE